MTGDKRKTFVAREDLLIRLNETARQNGRSLYETVNDILELAISADDASVSLREAIDEKNLIKSAKEKGMILGLENIWQELSALAYSSSKESAIAIWCGAGKWFAKRYLLEEANDPFSALKKDMESFSWNIHEFKIDRTDGVVSISAISPQFSEAYSIQFLAFIESCIETFGYKIVEKEASRGSLSLKAILR